LTQQQIDNVTKQSVKNNIDFSKEGINNCINNSSLNYCKQEWLKPSIIREAKDKGKIEWVKIKSYQTKTDAFTIEDLTQVITDEELND